MWLLAQTECQLIEQLSSGQQKETCIVWKEALWQQIEKGIVRFMKVLVQVLASPILQDDLLSRKSAADQKEFYNDLLKN